MYSVTVCMRQQIEGTYCVIHGLVDSQKVDSFVVGGFTKVLDGGKSRGDTIKSGSGRRRT